MQVGRAEGAILDITELSSHLWTEVDSSIHLAAIALASSFEVGHPSEITMRRGPQERYRRGILAQSEVVPINVIYLDNCTLSVINIPP